jgi:hypothetical protein
MRTLYDVWHVFICEPVTGQIQVCQGLTLRQQLAKLRGGIMETVKAQVSATYRGVHLKYLTQLFTKSQNSTTFWTIELKVTQEKTIAIDKLWRNICRFRFHLLEISAAEK